MCDNKIEIAVPSGWDYRTVEYRCGSTSIDGGMILCPACEPQRKHRQAIADAGNAWARSAGMGEI